MKRTILMAVYAAFIFLFIAALPQDKQPKGMDQHQDRRMIALMKDSALVNMMMDHIESDQGMRMNMMHKMMHRAKGDCMGMMQMGKMMTDDQEMQAMMMGVAAAQVTALESEVGLEQIKVIPELNVRVYTIIFDGELNADTIAGQFREGDAGGTFSLKRVEAKPPTFTQEEVSFRNGEAELRYS